MRFTRRAESSNKLDDGLATPPRPSWCVLVLGLVLPVVLAVLLVGVAATSVVLLRDRRDPQPVVEVLRPADLGAAGSRSTPAGEAVSRAELAVTTYFTLGYRRIDADMDRMRALGTPGFVESYDEETSALVTRVVARRIVLSATLPRNGAATEYLTADLAQVVVAVDVITRRAGTRNSTAYRIRVTLERSGDTWLVAAIDEVA